MKSKLSIDQVNYLNIGLMVVSAAAAFARPFELFLLAYALLGPLHYLTEISWLHDRRYFTKGKHDYLLLVGMSVLITLIGFGFISHLPAGTGTAVTFVAFSSALVFVLTGKAPARALVLLGLVAISGLVLKINVVYSVFNILLPTIIHVFLFTGLFILAGALRGRSVSGVSSLVVFVMCAMLFFLLHPTHGGYQVGDYVRRSYKDFQILNFALMTPFSLHNIDIPANLQQYIRYVNTVIYQSPAAFAVMGFIAFAYTYHYLNWFSKTSIIQWHNIPRSRLLGVIVLWLLSIAIYASDYSLGLRWLFFLSFTHVLLEFPLNHLTFINIGKELKTMVGMRGSKGTPVPVVASGPAKGARSARRP